MDEEKQAASRSASPSPVWMRSASPYRLRIDWLRAQPSRLIAVFLACVLAVQYLSSSTSLDNELRAHRSGPLPTRLSSNRFLTESQCRIAFPKLEDTLHGPRKYWKSRGGIQESWIVDQASAEQGRAVIVKNRLYVKRYGKGIDTRSLATFNAIRDAVITSLEPLPDVDFVFRTGDHAQKFHPQWQMVRHETDPDAKSVWLMPDFGIYAWPEPAINSFADFLEETDRVESEQPWSHKDPRLFWRGAMLSKGRDELVNLTANATWADVHPINWGDPNKAAPRVDIWDSCRYRFLAHTKGVAELYSGRLKYLLACESVVVQRSVEWDQHFHPAIDSRDGSPTQNTVVVPGDSWDQLPQVMEALLKDDRKARRIARNARNAFRHRYLSVAATNCYWRALIRSYGSVQAFTPTLYGATDYESFVLMRKVEWVPH